MRAIVEFDAEKLNLAVIERIGTPEERITQDGVRRHERQSGIRELAAVTGLNERTFHRLLHGQTTASYYTLDRIAVALGCHVSQFVREAS